MRINVTCRGGDYLHIIQDVIWLFYPGAELSRGEEGRNPDMILFIEVDREQNGQQEIALQAIYDGPGGQLTHREAAAPDFEEAENEVKRLARLAVYRLLCLATGREPGPWGIFTGIRPTKVVHRMLDAGLSAGEIIPRLESRFAVRPDRARLLTDIALRQRPFLLPHDTAGRLAAVYIGVPFCPTRCLYCSFPAYPLNRYGSLVDTFVNALLEEIRQVGGMLKKAGVEVQSIYIGGGTPTSLHEKQLSEVLLAVKDQFVDNKTAEFTVEAGRPDTLSGAKLEICAGAGVTRVSVNPQSMHQRTLHAIGREHTVEDIYRAVSLVREIGFPVLNMDLIIGLPGETPGEVAETVKKIGQFGPENITVHVLAVKRASRLRFELENHPLPGPEEARTMWEIARAQAEELGMLPYYLYRQKKMLGNLENIGYTLPGSECLYNIQVIEERQTIIGLGAGAGSKWLNPRDWTLVNKFNPKDPFVYIERLKEIIKDKKDRIKRLANLVP